MGFRHSLNAEKDSLDPETVKLRDNFLGRNRAYQELLTGALTIQKELIKLPLAPQPDSDDERKKRQLLSQLARVSSIQEAMMASYALSREPSTLAYPPQMSLDGFQRLIPRGTLCLSTLKTASGYHMFFVSKERVRYVNLGPAQGLDRAVTKLLRDIGAIGGSSTEAETLQSEAWKETAKEVKLGLFAEIPDKSFANIVELVVIPDGMLWYMPFEALPLQVDGKEQFLVDLCPIRYSPTMYLSVEFPGGAQLKRNTVAVGRMHNRGEVESTLAEVEELKKKFPDLESYEKQATPSGLSAWLTDHLMVWSESFLPNNGYDFQPVPFDVSGQSTIRAWMALPWYGPEYLSLPGLRTFGKGRKANGSEMFATTVALMSAGSRTIMLPRWPTGGAVSLGLSRLYAEHLSEKMNGPKALRQAMIDARSLKVDIEKEPQIKKEKDPGDVSAEHPFFWSSFMVVDQPRLKVENVEKGKLPPGMGAKPGVVVTPVPKVTTPKPPGGTSVTPAAASPKGPAADGAEEEKDSGAGEDSKAVEKPVPATEGEAKPKAPRKSGGVF